MPQVLGPRVEGEALHAAHLLPAAQTERGSQDTIVYGRQNWFQTDETDDSLFKCMEYKMGTNMLQYAHVCIRATIISFNYQLVNLSI